MGWKSFDEFIHMGGYGAFVWGSYGVTLLVLVLESRLAAARHRRARAGAGNGAQP